MGEVADWEGSCLSCGGHQQAPSYTHVDDVAARRVQAAWRGFMGKRKFAKLLEVRPWATRWEPEMGWREG